MNGNVKTDRQRLVELQIAQRQEIQRGRADQQDRTRDLQRRPLGAQQAGLRERIGDDQRQHEGAGVARPGDLQVSIWVLRYFAVVSRQANNATAPHIKAMPVRRWRRCCALSIAMEFVDGIGDELNGRRAVIYSGHRGFSSLPFRWQPSIQALVTSSWERLMDGMVLGLYLLATFLGGLTCGLAGFAMGLVVSGI